MKKRNIFPNESVNPVILQQQIYYLKAELDKYRSRVNDYQGNYHYNQLEKLKIENSTLHNELNKYQGQMEEMNKNNRSLQNMIVEKNSQLKQLRNELEETHYTKKKQEEAQKEQENIQKNLLIKMAELEKEIEILQTLKFETENSLVDFKEQYEQIKSDHHRLQLEIGNRDSTIQEQKKHIEKLEGEMMNVRNSFQQVEAEKRKWLEESNIYREEAEKQKQTVLQLQKHIASLESKLLFLNDKQTQSEKTIQELQHTNQLLSEKNKQLIREAQSNKEEMKNKQNHVQQLQNQINSLEQRLTEYRDKHLKSETEIKDLQIINERLKDERQQLKEDKLTLENFQIDMFDKIEELKQEIISYKSREMATSSFQNSNQLTENNKLFKQIQVLLEQINEYGEKVSASVSLTNRLEEHIDELTVEIKKLKSKLPVSSVHEKTL
ncbi:hypothetical protein JMM81_07770 [Bacillus sp. V3B]|uniref:hypothetical protein n=1 Tax=Bacillus sp. V3B TaxID=2804915 RepID=UPI00210CDB92|nr:hypothetical protein [Bacillus sp. V3B]MCQ6274862.1 hypothetical protein [Bacillus sp. V3B]